MSQRHQSHAKTPESSCHVPIARCKFPDQYNDADEERRSDEFQLNSCASEVVPDDQVLDKRWQTIGMLSARHRAIADNAVDL
jgi:hypothetical protein